MPVWWDIEGDERPELLYVSANGLERLTATGDGAHALAPVPMAPGVTEDFGPGRATLATLDLDGDGREELLVFGGEAHAYRVTGGQITRVETTWPEAPLMSLNDAAVGDLNRDGRPDIYFALGRINWEQIHLSGRPDVLWMNRGDGRFEASEVPHPRAALTRGATLLILDNAEQVSDDAAPIFARWVDALPSVRFLVTSRERLNIGSERVLHLAPLKQTAGAETVDQD